MLGNQERNLKIQGHYRHNKEVPELRLTGVWMERLGFRIGERVSVTMRERLLIIEPAASGEADYKLALQDVKQTLKKLSR